MSLTYTILEALRAKNYSGAQTAFNAVMHQKVQEAMLSESAKLMEEDKKDGKDFPINVNPTDDDKKDVKDRLLKQGKYKKELDSDMDSDIHDFAADEPSKR